MATKTNLESLELPACSDFHVHLRDGDMMKAVVPTIRSGGVNMIYVMPNLQPPIKSVKEALDYKARLQAIEPKVTFLMSLYLCEATTPEIIREAKAAGITGVKSYPAGVTTNSASGVTDYAAFYPVFAEMEKVNLILNLHGECRSGDGINELNAEQAFLPTLLDLHARFPKLRIILEHCTTEAAIEAVRKCGPTVAGTITAHHLYLTEDDWRRDPFSFCKPVAKRDADRDVLLQTVASGDSKFFLGTDSAPHAVKAKLEGAAGVFTQPYAAQLVLQALEDGIKVKLLKEDALSQKILVGFLGEHGRRFYDVDDVHHERITIRRRTNKLNEFVGGTTEDTKIQIFRASSQVWDISWKSDS